MINNNLGLYIHVPFCKSKCPYCDFYSVCSLDNYKKDKYTQQIINEIKNWSKKLNQTVDTIYFGGGTPTLLGHQRLSRIISCVKDFFDVSNICEITIEANPNLPDHFDFSYLKKQGLNRVSLGVQSSNLSELKLLGRTHSLNDISDTVQHIKKSGINNISFDLMLGIQLQTKQSIKDSIDFAVSANIQHISAYILKIEEKTLYFKTKDKLTLPNDDEQAQLYLFACDYLNTNGFFQYEISNFCQPGFESKHNLKYWNCDDYLGLGSSAHSYINGIRFFTEKNLNSFISKPTYFYENNNSIFDSDNFFIQSKNQKNIEEYIMLRLRCTNGLSKNKFHSKFGFDIPKKYLNNANYFKNTDLITISSEKIALSPKGFLVSNILIAKILYGEI